MNFLATRRTARFLSSVSLTLALAGCGGSEANSNGVAPGGADGSGGQGNGTGGAATGGSTGTGGRPSYGPGGALHLEPRDYARLFFTGHSLLDNPIPDFVELIARSKEDDVGWNQQNILGSPIRVRTQGSGNWEGYGVGKNRAGEGLDVVNELLTGATLGPDEGYDTLVIVERNDLLDTIVWEDTTGLLLHYHDRLIDGNSAGRTLFHQVWPSIDKDNPQSWLDHVRLELTATECVVSKNNLYLESAGRSDRMGVSPGGLALAALVDAALAGEVPGMTGTPRQRLDAIFSDDVHLTRVATYMVASVIYGAVYGKTPVGAAYPEEDMSQETAEVLQQIAWDVLAGYHQEQSPWTMTMEACREHFAQHYCPSARALFSNPEGIPNCAPEWGNPDWERNVFRWPDPTFEPHPAP